jgi:hypothetical protein
MGSRLGTDGGGLDDKRVRALAQDVVGTGTGGGREEDEDSRQRDKDVWRQSGLKRRSGGKDERTTSGHRGEDERQQGRGQAAAEWKVAEASRPTRNGGRRWSGRWATEANGLVQQVVMRGGISCARRRKAVCEPLLLALYFHVGWGNATAVHGSRIQMFGSTSAEIF